MARFPNIVPTSAPAHFSLLPMAPVSKKPQQTTISSFFSIHRKIVEKGINLTRRLSLGRGDVIRRISEVYRGTALPRQQGFDNFPTELLWEVFQRIEIRDLYNVAKVSKRCLKIVQDYYLSSSFRSKMKTAMVSDVEQCFDLLLNSVSRRVDYILDFFNCHYPTTRCKFNWDNFMFRVYSKLSVDEQRDFSNLFVDRLKPDAINLVKCCYPNFHKADDTTVGTSRAFHMLFRSVICQDSFVRVLERVLHWFLRSCERACFMIAVFCDNFDNQESLNMLVNQDLSDFENAKKHFSDICQALQALCLAVARGTSSFSEYHIFGIVESVTKPWALRNFVAALFLAPEAFRIFCEVRFQLVQYDELVDIIFEALSAFDSWNLSYLNVFFGVLHDFMVSDDAAGDPKAKFVYIFSELWERFMDVMVERPFLDPSVLAFHTKLQVFMDVSFTGVN